MNQAPASVFAFPLVLAIMTKPMCMTMLSTATPSRSQSQKRTSEWQA